MKLSNQDQERAAMQADKDLILAMPDRDGELDPGVLNQVLSRLANERQLTVEVTRLRLDVESLTKLVRDKNAVLNKIRAGRYMTKTKLNRAITYHFSREKSVQSVLDLGVNMEVGHVKRHKHK